MLLKNARHMIKEVSHLESNLEQLNEQELKKILRDIIKKHNELTRPLQEMKETDNLAKILEVALYSAMAEQKLHTLSQNEKDVFVQLFHKLTKGSYVGKNDYKSHSDIHNFKLEWEKKEKLRKFGGVETFGMVEPEIFKQLENKIPEWKKLPTINSLCLDAPYCSRI